MSSSKKSRQASSPTAQPEEDIAALERAISILRQQLPANESPQHVDALAAASQLHLADGSRGGASRNFVAEQQPMINFNHPHYHGRSPNQGGQFQNISTSRPGVSAGHSTFDANSHNETTIYGNAAFENHLSPNTALQSPIYSSSQVTSWNAEATLQTQLLEPGFQIQDNLTTVGGFSFPQQQPLDLDSTFEDGLFPMPSAHSMVETSFNDLFNAEDDSIHNNYPSSNSESPAETSAEELHDETDIWQHDPYDGDKKEELGTSSGSNSSWLVVGNPDEQPSSSNARGGSSPRRRSKDLTWVMSDRKSKLASHMKQRRRPFTDERLRKQTGETRRNKACVRCRNQKVRCVADETDPTGACGTCKAVSIQKIYTLPCVRYKITECTLYRIGKAPGLEFTFRWPVMKLKDITDWASSSPVRVIKLKSDVCPVPLQLAVRRFNPHVKDSLKKGWMDGKVKKFKITTPFAIAKMQPAVQDMQNYIDANFISCLKHVVLDSEMIDPLVRETYNFAVQYQKLHKDDEEGILLGNFFRLWFAIRRTATTEHIVGDDTLDMEPETEDRSYPLFGKVPVPPVMIQQLDMILTLGFLKPLRKKVLEEFQRMATATKPQTWLTVYLITFMFLHSCSALSAENYQNARKHGLRRRFSMPAFIAELHHGANSFLAHYHYRTQPCNPFHMDWKRRQTTPFASMSTYEIHFLRRTMNLVKEREETFQYNLGTELYEDDLYFIGQMFEKDWSPKSTTIDYDDGTVAEVPLRQFYEPSK